MNYASRTIGTVIDDVNRTYLLPAIQRPFVWSSSQIIALFDSLLKGYPISSFMFWAIDEATKAEVRSYKFIENYSQDARNEPTSTVGRKTILVLDGQQRMTSLLIGLRGTFSEKAKGARRSNPSAWSIKTLYIDLLKDPAETDPENDSELGVTYGFAFHERRPADTHRHHWFKVGAILDYATEERLEGLITKVKSELHHGVTSYDHQIAEDILRRLHRVVWQDEAINFHTETDQSPDRVLDIFVRANDGGVKLSKADLLLSMITSKWSSGSARDEIYKFVDYINRDLGAPNKVSRDFVLKACLVACDYDVVYNVRNFTTQAIAEIEQKWESIKRAIENTFRLLNRHGITGENLGSLNAIMPLVYYIYNTPDFDFRGSSEFEGANAAAMHHWLLNSLLVSAFVGHSDQTITTARATIREHLRIARDFPVTKLFDAMAKGGRLSQVDERTIEELLEMQYGRPRTFVALSLLYPGLDWNGSNWHVDHIIPQADAQKNVLRGRNLPEHRIAEIIAAANSLGNLQLLRADENIEKSAIPFRSWITGRDREFLKCHMIPDQADLWDVTTLPEFVREREKLIRQSLLKLVGRKAA
ncbi:GmrSD restriction endonuclease domain-containing protein [Paracoccus methylarcula]|uniref:DUF262 domain-containing protein n=1 Tax=Paracoccus methylarcula TaxID=72022 RepID=A0A3R7LHB5_9RHOB|nr:DUF262 domain-containing protein [Paracoccus methylarcula]RNF33974.1 DUF262 domain-containing protein [Paracoccus methylarcula]